MTKQQIKNKLIQICKSEIEKRISLNDKLMKEEQNTANQYKGAMESRYDTFKEEAQSRKDAYAMQIDKLLKLNSVLLTLKNEPLECAGLGSVIETNLSNYFLFYYLFDDAVEIEKKTFFIISMESPIGIALQNKKINDKFMFNGKEIIISDVY